MIRDEFARKWRELRGPIQGRWPDLTDGELDEIGGDYDRLVDKIQEKTGETRGLVETEVTKLFTVAPVPPAETPPASP